ncbi:MAG: 23S rRNA (pseudouridine(1915)-N(3))-methyltransferase RlmH [Lachnospiraceae bacterium]|nr:23S rRNA (pseudouridine(1915)-N(3))-methyltransferase RlmH [Lachnospiraceae bacterium]MCR5477132.1 23S rRNA (pseudouridine(1915)-N(3))-methyltransferase RlmH [Lachnospiraceae bacterium]
MKIRILCVGRMKESYLREAFGEYEKRLGRYCTLQVTEVPDEKTVEDPTPPQREKILRTEGARLLEKIPEKAAVWTLEIGGKQLSSEELAEAIEREGVYGSGELVFVIGGSLGLSPEVTKRADLHLSFSRMTFPHQLMRVILAEAIYRSFRIINKEPYHK